MLTLPPNLDANKFVAHIDAAIRELESLRRQITAVAEPMAHSQPAAIEGWLKGFQFTSDDIARARSEMWIRFQLA